MSVAPYSAAPPAPAPVCTAPEHRVPSAVTFQAANEDYVRPPIVAVERPSYRAAVWRFRLVFALVLAAIVVGVFFLYQALTSGPGEGSPGINNPQGLSVAVLGR